jgi:hypothetical protein
MNIVKGTKYSKIFHKKKERKVNLPNMELAKYAHPIPYPKLK